MNLIRSFAAPSSGTRKDSALLDATILEQVVVRYGRTSRQLLAVLKDESVTRDPRPPFASPKKLGHFVGLRNHFFLICERSFFVAELNSGLKHFCCIFLSFRGFPELYRSRAVQL